MKDKYKKFYMMFDKRFKNLILCSNLNSDRRMKKISYQVQGSAKEPYNITIALDGTKDTLLQWSNSQK